MHTSRQSIRRLWCIVRRYHARKPYDAGDRSNERADAYCGRCGQCIAQNLSAKRQETP